MLLHFNVFDPKAPAPSCIRARAGAAASVDGQLHEYLMAETVTVLPMPGQVATDVLKLGRLHLDRGAVVGVVKHELEVAVALLVPHGPHLAPHYMWPYARYVLF